MKKYFALFGIAFLGLAVSYSCRKKKDTIAKVTVLDKANNTPVSDCRVVLYGQASEPEKQSNVVLFDTAFTNAAGEAIFNYNEVYQLGQAGVAVLNIKADKNGLSGTGIIKVEEETTSEETVFI